MTITWSEANSNNFEAGRRGNKPQLIILHWIVGTLASADATFQNATKQVSAHYGIGGDQVHQYVKEEDTAYHAGNFDVNLRSIGIEHEGGPNLPISNETIATSAQLVREIAQRYSIPLDREHIKGHREIVATQCPGTLPIDQIIALAKNANVEPTQTVTLDGKKFEELVSKATQRDEYVKAGFDSVEKVKTLLAEKDNIIKGMNETIDAKNKQISQAQAEVSSLNNQLLSAQQSIDSLTPLAKQVPQLQEVLTATEQRVKDKDVEIEKLMRSIGQYRANDRDYRTAKVQILLLEILKAVIQKRW